MHEPAHPAHCITRRPRHRRDRARRKCNRVAVLGRITGPLRSLRPQRERERRCRAEQDRRHDEPELAPRFVPRRDSRGRSPRQGRELHQSGPGECTTAGGLQWIRGNGRRMSREGREGDLAETEHVGRSFTQFTRARTFRPPSAGPHVPLPRPPPGPPPPSAYQSPLVSAGCARSRLYMSVLERRGILWHSHCDRVAPSPQPMPPRGPAPPPGPSPPFLPPPPAVPPPRTLPPPPLEPPPVGMAMRAG